MNLLAKMDWHDTGSGKMVFHQPPIRRSVFFERLEGFRENYFLSFPDILFVVFYRNICYPFRTEDPPEFASVNLYAVLTNKEFTEFAEFPLPNFFDDLSVCLTYGQTKTATPEEACRQIIKDFWDSKFDLSVSDALLETQFRSLSDYAAFLDAWENDTKKSTQWAPKLNTLPEHDAGYMRFLVQTEIFKKFFQHYNYPPRLEIHPSTPPDLVKLISPIGVKDAF